MKCPICNREMVEGTYNDHHLIPSTFGGRDTITLHKICHDKIHHTFSERDLANYYFTIERILEHEEIIKFIKWVQKRPPDFYVKHKDTNERRGKRKK